MIKWRKITPYNKIPTNQQKRIMESKPLFGNDNNWFCQKLLMDTKTSGLMFEEYKILR